MTTTTNARSYLNDVAPELVGILAKPEDDTPRLIYADWLEDRGEAERAEFIRVQCELEVDGLRSAECKGSVFHSFECPKVNWDRCERSHILKGRERDLFACHKCNWFGESTAIHYLEHEREDSEGQYENCLKSIVRRGFIAEIHAPLAVLQKHLHKLVREHPITLARATDKEPLRQSESTQTVFVWWNHHGRFNGLPEEVWELLDLSPHATYRHAKDYPTADAAHAALSVALLEWAKGQSIEVNQ